MSTHRVTFEVDGDQLFDTLQSMKGNFGPLGHRLVEILLAPKAADFVTQVGMGIYGVRLASVDPAPAEPASPHPGGLT